MADLTIEDERDDWIAKLNYAENLNQRLAGALRNLQLVAFDAAINSVPEAHITLRQELERCCNQARAVLRYTT